MARSENLRIVSLPTLGSGTNAQFRFQAFVGAMLVNAAAGQECIGVSLDASNAELTPIPVALLTGGGKCEVEAGAAISIGDLVASDAAGKVVTATTGDHILGHALEAALADGDVITVLFDKKIAVSL